jgi:hypothetical protein
MKKLIVLLFIPFISIGQITFKDIMSISSLDQFKRVMIENNYEFDSIDKDGDILYGFNIAKDSTSWAWHSKTGNRWSVSFTRSNLLSEWLGAEADNSENSYDLIVKDIKEKCKFYKIITTKISKDDFSCYSCASSTYKGKIGFMIREKTGFIKHFPEE